MSTPRKKVLIVTYYFPPSGGSGVQRTLKFVKYLREFGWEPVVLTARDADYPVYDESLFSEVPEGVRVYRSRIWEPYRFYRKLTGRQASESTDIAALTRDVETQRRFSERLSEWVRAAFFVPDGRVGWKPFAYRLGKKILADEEIQVIFSSAPPYTTHLIARRLKRASGLPWVADFRDSWIGWLSAPQWRPRLARKLELRMEGAVLREADRLLAVSHGVREDLLSRHPEAAGDRWAWLPNGYDAADFEAVQPVPRNHRLTLTYVGSLYGPRNPEALVRALEQLKGEGGAELARLRVRFVGRIGQPILERLKRSKVSAMFDVVPYVSHAESLAYLLATDVALLIIDDAPANRGILTGKLFEYIGAGKPILALAPEGEAADLIRSENLGWVVPPDDPEAVRKTLLELLQNQKLDQLRTNQKMRRKFERRQQTQELARILDELRA